MTVFIKSVDYPRYDPLESLKERKLANSQQM